MILKSEAGTRLEAVDVTAWQPRLPLPRLDTMSYRSRSDERCFSACILPAAVVVPERWTDSSSTLAQVGCALCRVAGACVSW